MKHVWGEVAISQNYRSTAGRKMVGRNRSSWKVAPQILISIVFTTSLLLAVTAQTEEFVDPTIKVSAEPAVLIATGKQLRYATKVVKLPDGSLFVQGYRSTDGGATWTQASDQVMAAFSDGWRQLSSCVLRDGTYVGLGMKTENPDLDRHVLKVYTSSDRLRTIDGPRNAFLHIPEGTGGYVETGEFASGTYVDHGLIETHNGTLLATCYGWWWGDETYSMLEKYVPELGLFKYRSWVIASTDRGETWRVQGTPGYVPNLGPEGMCEPDIAELANGDLLMQFRNGEGAQPCFQSRSQDGGKTWTRPIRLQATGSWPSLCVLSNGYLVAAHGRPDYTLWVSPDGRGTSWTSRTTVAREGAGYASIVESSAGRLVFVGYGKLDSGQEGLLAWRIHVERLK